MSNKVKGSMERDREDKINMWAGLVFFQTLAELLHAFCHYAVYLPSP